MSIRDIRNNLSARSARLDREAIRDEKRVLDDAKRRGRQSYLGRKGRAYLKRRMRERKSSR